jgi:nuclear GTP-binding protein
MGGHKKHSRNPRGNPLRSRGRNCHPDDRAVIGRGLDVPGEDLRRAGKRVGDNKAKREEALVTIRAAKAAKRDKYSGGDGRHALAAMALQAVKGQEAFTARMTAKATGAAGSTGVDLSLRKYSKEFKSVIEQSDVLLQVLDARDPLGCRLFEFEQAISSQYGEGKTIVMILNKADMVPDPSVLDEWVNYFADQHIAAVPFTARPQTSNGHAARFERCVADVFRVLRKLGRVDDTSSARKSLTVGVIGYPNVGKSSTINALKGKNVVAVGNMPGFTTGNTEVDLRGDIKIIDCPGVVVKGADGADVVLRNAAKLSEVEDPVVIIERALERTDIGVLCAVYGVPAPSVMGNATAEFLRAVALKRGRVRSGGHLEIMEAARLVLKDWNDGRIVHYTKPPESMGFTVGMHGEELTDAPELLTTLTAPTGSTLPQFIVLAPEGPAVEWTVPDTLKHAGKIKYHPTDTSSDEDDDDNNNNNGYDSDGLQNA